MPACLVGHSTQVMAATSPTAENPVNTNREFEALPVSGNFTKAVGRYQFNYTGNINYYSAPSSGSDDIQMSNNVLSGYETSSMGTLYGDGNTRIVKAICSGRHGRDTTSGMKILIMWLLCIERIKVFTV